MKVTKRAWLSLGLISIGYNLVLYMQACLLNGLTAQLKGSDQPRYTLRPITSCMLPRKALFLFRRERLPRHLYAPA